MPVEELPKLGWRAFLGDTTELQVAADLLNELPVRVGAVAPRGAQSSFLPCRTLAGFDGSAKPVVNHRGHACVIRLRIDECRGVAGKGKSICTSFCFIGVLRLGTRLAIGPITSLSM